MKATLEIRGFEVRPRQGKPDIKVLTLVDAELGADGFKHFLEYMLRPDDEKLLGDVTKLPGQRFTFGINDIQASFGRMNLRGRILGPASKS